MRTEKHIRISIRRSAAEIYDFTSNPTNLPLWAAGLTGASITRSGDRWVCDSPMGRVEVKFAEKNSLGIMDHEVILPSGEINHNPFRVLENGSFGEVVFTLIKRAGMSEEDFALDAAQVTKDLEKLKELLEA